MVTSERVILYQTDDSEPDQFHIIHSYDFHTPLVILPNGLFEISHHHPLFFFA